ncbi:ABC transporter substrate-binding protein [Phytoactinopolyspora limicola]|uniref:ABC transporter substrate-binding protein n=1 Tax=Phytoactinopolyspora limicola TaxID=2715536 RepID=UPI00140C9024|nr:ABC transporter substrate-binding protein [Phytoactinopolyspora limicola]
MRITSMIGTTGMLALLLVSACASAAGDGGDGNGGATHDGEFVVNGTFTTSVAGDAGNLHPHLTTDSNSRTVIAFAHDKLVYFTQDGDALPWLADSWDVTPTSVTYTIRDGVTCSDGTALAASQVAANFEFIVDPANGSPIRGVFVPHDLEVTADDDARTVTITVEQPDPFLFHSTGELFIACEAGLTDPELLTSASISSGMYQVADVATGDSYTLERRDDYAWGPEETTASVPGTPKTIVLRVVEDEATAVNLFLAGELDAVTVTGVDRQRFESQDFDQLTSRGVVGELYFNQTSGEPGADQEVRRALTQALDVHELMAVMTSGTGEMSRSVSALEPAACDYDAVSDYLLERDVEAARRTLDAAGWTEGTDGVRQKDGRRLEMTVIHQNTPPGNTSAAELITQQWREVGVDATSRSTTPVAFNSVVFDTGGTWHAALVSLNTRMPSQLVPFFSGATPPDGTNFSHIDNDAYLSAVAEAMQLPGTDSCPKWKEAEQALFAAYDVVMFADDYVPTYLDGVSAARGQDGIVAPTIRLRAN